MAAMLADPAKSALWLFHEKVYLCQVRLGGRRPATTPSATLPYALLSEPVFDEARCKLRSVQNGRCNLSAGLEGLEPERSRPDWAVGLIQSIVMPLLNRCR